MSVLTSLMDTRAGKSVAAAHARWRDRLPAATPAIVAYVAVRAVAMIVLLILARRAGTDFTQMLSNRFDAQAYRSIADRGYDLALPVNPDGTLRTTNLAFFPLYPGLIVLVMAITPLSSGAAGLIVSWTAGIAAAWGIYAVGRHLHSHLTGVLLAALWGVVPHALVQSMAYSETLFTALVAWSLYALLRRRWLTAGGLCFLAGLTRPPAIALIAAVGLAALVAIIRRQDGWRPWVAGAIAPLGYIGYVLWVGNRLGRLDGYFYMQREAWGITFDGGRDTLRVTGKILTETNQLLAFYMIVFLLAVAIALLALMLMNRYPLPIVVYSVASMILILGAAGGYQGKARYLVPLFTILLPVAVALTNALTRTRVVVLLLLMTVTAWYGTYLTMVWRWSP